MTTSTSYKSLRIKTLNGIIKGIKHYDETRGVLQKKINNELEKHTGINFNGLEMPTDLSMCSLKTFNVLELDKKMEWSGDLADYLCQREIVVHGVYYSALACIPLFDLAVRIHTKNERLYFKFELEESINSDTFSDSHLINFAEIRILVISFGIPIT